VQPPIGLALQEMDVDTFKSIAVPVRRREAMAKRRTGKPSPSTESDLAPTQNEFRRQPRQTTAHPVHRYRVGQRLALASGSREFRRPSATCQVTALLPHEAGPLLYRVRSDAENFERVVDEIDLAPLR